MNRPHGKAIIMGASSGIGLEVARLLQQDGWTLGLAARRLAPLQTLQQQAPQRTFVAQIDVNAEEAEANLQKLIEQMGGDVNLYVHVAGIGWQNPDIQAEEELSTMQTNAVGFTRMIGAAFRYFAKREGGGHIAAITSIAGTRGLGQAPAYSATKALQTTYLEALTQLVHMRKLPIVITDLRPGFVRTSLLGDSSHYPMLMQPTKVAHRIVRAIYRQKAVCVIDYRWQLLTALWSLIPHCLWRKLTIRTKGVRRS